MKSARTFLLCAALAAAACGDRPDAFDTTPSVLGSFSLGDRVALVDASVNRVVLLTPNASSELARESLPVGKGAVAAQTSPDGKRLFVLSRGDVIRRRASDEAPSLTVIEGTTARRFVLESAHSGFVVDPEGRYVALFAASSVAGASGSFVENPNEIILIDLTAPAEIAVTSRTLRSFGGRPQRLTFTRPLLLPEGPRRLLVVETNQDISLLDLDNLWATPPRPEITVRLTSGASAKALTPGGVVVDDGDPARNDDARIGVRIGNDTNVVTITLVPAPAGTVAEDPDMRPNDFRAELNLTDVGGIPGSVAFLRTDAGLRLAALVPSTSSAVLVDPETSITTSVSLPGAFTGVSLITSIVGGGAGTDTALLYGGSAGSGVAFWSLGRAAGQPYRSVEVVSLGGAAVQEVLDVPPPRPELKLLRGQTGLFVLNLATRTASPLTTASAATVHVAADGERFWAFQQGGSQISRVSLDNLHPVSLPVDRSVTALFDVARPDGRSVVAIDTRGGVGATVFDVAAPDSVAARNYYGLLLEGLQ